MTRVAVNNFVRWYQQTVILLLCGLVQPVLATETPIFTEGGQLGVIRYPSARSLPAGTVTTGLTVGQPFTQFYTGWQPLPALNVTLRQAYETHTSNTFPGVDAKLQLWREDEWLPQTAIGYQQAFGHGRLAGEYMVATKRVWDLDWNLGAGWGRLGRDRALPNPFGKDDTARDAGLGSAGPRHWLRGKRLGLFGGVNYAIADTPWTLQLEYDPDDFRNEQLAGDGVAKRIPANLGVHYQYDNIGVALSWQQGDRLGLQLNYNWQPATLPAVRPPPQIIPLAARSDSETATLVFRNPPDQIPAAGLGQAATRLSQQVLPHTQQLTLIPEQSGLTTTEWHLPNWQVQQAEINDRSAAEIWQSTEVTAAQPPRPWSAAPSDPWRWQTGLQVDASLYEPQQFYVSREKLLFGSSYEPTAGLFFNVLGRVDHGSHTNQIIQKPKAVRSWLEQYTQRGYGVERGYTAHYLIA